MYLSNELNKAQEFVGENNLTEFKIIWQHEEEQIELGFIEEQFVEEDDIVEEGFESLYDLAIAIAEYSNPPHFVKLVHRNTGTEHIFFKRN